MNRRLVKQTPPWVASWISLVFLVVSVALIGGIVGVAMVSVMFWLSGKGWAVDDAGSHGISEQHSSRLGGIAAFLGAIAFYVSFSWVKNPSTFLSSWLQIEDALFSQHLVYVVGIALIGLWDDFAGELSATVRLLSVMVLVWCGLMFTPNLLPAASYEWLPGSLENSLVLVFAATLLVTGFVNAGNMADGANGLLTLVVLAHIILAYEYGYADYQLAVIMSLTIFLFFNVSTGRIFLGDFGAYGLSAMVGFGSLRLYADSEVSLWLLGSVLAYPCIEMLRVIISRRMRGSSPLQSANDHVHNFLYRMLIERGWQRTQANSLTGCLIGGLSAMVPSLLAVLGVFDPKASLVWLIYFITYAVIHLISAHYLRRLVDAV